MLFTFAKSSRLTEQARELEISIYWKDWRGMSAVKFLRLEEFLDNKRHSLTLPMEPQGILFVEVSKITLRFSSRLPDLIKSQKLIRRLQ